MLAGTAGTLSTLIIEFGGSTMLYWARWSITHWRACAIIDFLAPSLKVADQSDSRWQLGKFIMPIAVGGL